MTKQVLVAIADGSEEIEAVTVIDVLRRAGAEVTVASVEAQLMITASRGVKLVADRLVSACREEYDLIVLPGGMPGAERLRDCRALVELLQRQREGGRRYAAICAAPAVALLPHGLLEQTRATAHPAFQQQLPAALASVERVVVDGLCITSRGPGTALEFALTLVAELYGQAAADAVAAPMVVP